MRSLRSFNEGHGMGEILKSVINQAVPVAARGPGITGLGGTVSEKDKEKVCKGFESYFINNMLQELQKTTQFSEKGYMEQTYMSIVYEKVADYLADKGIGIKEMLMRYADKGNTKVLSGNGDNVNK
jgi:hypothetical protein